MLRARFSLGLIWGLFILFALAVWAATGFGWLAAYFPLAVALVGTALAAIELLLSRFQAAPAEAPQQAEEADAEFRKNLVGGARNFLWIAIYLVGCILAGFLSSTLVFLFLMLWRGAGYRPHIAALLGLAACVFLYVFGGFIGLVLPAGWIDDALLDFADPLLRELSAAASRSISHFVL